MVPGPTHRPGVHAQLGRLLERQFRLARAGSRAERLSLVQGRAARHRRAHATVADAWLAGTVFEFIDIIPSDRSSPPRPRSSPEPDRHPPQSAGRSTRPPATSQPHRGGAPVLRGAGHLASGGNRLPMNPGHQAADAGLRTDRLARRPPDPRPSRVTFANGTDGDICIWWTHVL